MDAICHECGAPLPDGSTCQDHFYTMLALEAQIPGGPSRVAHYYAVSTYALQHPEGMRYKVETLRNLRAALADHVSGRLTLEQILAQTRQAANGPQRVIRRDGDPVPSWPITSWPLTVVHVLEGGVAGYEERTAAWARSAIEALESAGA